MKPHGQPRGGREPLFSAQGRRARSQTFPSLRPVLLTAPWRLIGAMSNHSLLLASITGISKGGEGGGW